MSWSQIAKRFGVTKGGPNSSYREAKAKIERAANPSPPQPVKREPKASASSTEVLKPDETAEFLDTALEPFVTIQKAAEQCGFPPSTAKRLMKRMATRYKPLRDAVSNVKDEELLLLLEDRAKRALEYADDFVMAGASLKDLMVSAGIAIDKARLLKGEPTQITTIKDIRKLDEVGKLLQAEMERRGMIIDVTPNGDKPALS